MNNFQKNLLKEYFKLILSEKFHKDVDRVHQSIHNLNSFDNKVRRSAIKWKDHMHLFNLLKKNINDKDLFQKIKNFGSEEYEVPDYLEQALIDSNSQEGGGVPDDMLNYSYTFPEILDEYIRISEERDAKTFFNYSLNYRKGPSLKEAIQDLRPDSVYLNLSKGNAILAFAFEFFDRYFYEGNFIEDFSNTPGLRRSAV
jgi:hypothetical protein